MRVAIVTDSTSDIPLPILEELNIIQIPAILLLDGQSYQDGFDLTREEFYRRLPQYNPLPTTAAPAVGSFQNIYERILKKGYHHIISIHAASNLSGIYNAARVAAEGFQGRITTIDSRQLSLGLGFQALAAAMAAGKDMVVEKIIHQIESVRMNTHLFALLDTFEFIHRSGRVSWAKAHLGALLNIKPIVELRDGNVIQRGLTRTRSKGIQQLGDYLKKLGQLENLAILHTNAKEEGKQFLETHRHLIPEQPMLVNVTTIIGTHVGPRGLGFAAVVK